MSVSTNQPQVNDLTIVQGDSYLNSAGTAIVFTKDTGYVWPTDLTSYTVSIKATPTTQTLADTPGATALGPITGTVVTATGSGQAVRFDLTAAQTAALTAGANGYTYDVQAASGSERATLVMGTMTVKPQVNSA